MTTHDRIIHLCSQPCWADTMHPYSQSFIDAVLQEIRSCSGGARWPSPVGYTAFQGKATPCGLRLGALPDEPHRFFNHPTVDRGYGPQEVFVGEAIDYAVKQLHEAGKVHFLWRYGYVWIIAGPRTNHRMRDGDEWLDTPGGSGPNNWDRLDVVPVHLRGHAAPAPEPSEDELVWKEPCDDCGGGNDNSVHSYCQHL